MEQTLLSKDNVYRLSNSLVLDVLILVVIYYLPTISHHLAFPLYMLDPMRIVLFSGIILSRNKINSFFLATTIPLFSFFVGGHPVLLKSAIISIELLANVALFWILIHRWESVFAATFASIVAAKMIYYLAKYIIVEMGWLQMDIISTPFYIQGIVAIVVSALMCFFYRK